MCIVLIFYSSFTHDFKRLISSLIVRLSKRPKEKSKRAFVQFYKVTACPLLPLEVECVRVCSPTNTCHNRKTPLVILYKKLFTQWQERHAPGVRNASASRGRGQEERAPGCRRIEKAALFPSHNSEQVESPVHPCPLKPHVNATSKTHGHLASPKKPFFPSAKWTSLPRWK